MQNLNHGIVTVEHFLQNYVAANLVSQNARKTETTFLEAWPMRLVSKLFRMTVLRCKLVGAEGVVDGVQGVRGHQRRRFDGSSQIPAPPADTANCEAARTTLPSNPDIAAFRKCANDKPISVPCCRKLMPFAKYYDCLSVPSYRTEVDTFLKGVTTVAEVEKACIS
ncbi:hypothetical protein VOLCADRAFT_118937 [Volvox carteri f. nagariensis]|uniref:Uncharacterized protein n=1 Tax=Volvox carteri f. nagariensis TaxID=3068 RepID=D8U8T1_VOLCA|nr:uncharacterized protein VOLCADRAFT_118937 [Volvox carteri f. nagariensis]EFJ43861.1 hypothetical protein VOLCADRAFT_118937 [Volvox carteri f. nagariensis]|eukprot:XP_002955107.1 hypothetical protein VOLCADRAFT_118937 [Volvox carteri f. nagariensis]